MKSKKTKIWTYHILMNLINEKNSKQQTHRITMENLNWLKLYNPLFLKHRTQLRLSLTCRIKKSETRSSLVETPKICHIARGNVANRTSPIPLSGIGTSLSSWAPVSSLRERTNSLESTNHIEKLLAGFFRKLRRLTWQPTVLRNWFCQHNSK